MCSIDYEMPVFAHSPQPVGFLAGSNYVFKDFPRMPSQNPPRYCNWSRHLQHSESSDTISVSKPISLNGTKYSAPPKRPCLVIRSSEDSSSSTSDEESSNCSSGAQSPTRNKKRVRVMTEPSNVPPLWMNFHFLEDVTRGVDADPGVATEDRWQITFAQPASDYVEFRKRLDEGNVRVNVIYDTFSFKMQLPLRTQKIEFCVCYSCNGTQYWDNNQNKNYVVLKKMPIQLNKSLSADDLYAKRDLIGSSTAQPKVPVTPKSKAVQMRYSACRVAADTDNKTEKI
nr:unnamed protein product [Callosobruchus analis]